MSEDRGDADRLLDQIASEQDLIDQLATGAPRPQAVQHDTRDSDALSRAGLRRDLTHRHAALEAGA